MVPILSAFKITTVATYTTTITAGSTSETSTAATLSGSRNSLIAGAATGSIVGLTMILGALTYWIRRRKNRLAAESIVRSESADPIYDKAQLHSDQLTPPGEFDASPIPPREMEASTIRPQEMDASTSAQEIVKQRT
ncbi:hypothetical protein B0T26DRAFT_729193 [Lasiosphaeria miniovina]|uniref:Uncharacterized protein n=1 Tax=Lasiosphaeria miniovina TaxID=1954250 RepID=A0AA40A149_9PEZI|nr:uncharacterized protein B0T26DRAFT_729193 [Lasiosphaeria miniovina]KAK0707124.1 hypothetical protein B0T26DRAFT_729193 [Lasiosphaeria miniovina]